MSTLPLDTSVQAEYADGFILDETEHNDQSAYVEMEMVDMHGQLIPTGPNTLNDITEKRPEAEHGPMVRFSVFYKNMRHDIDWTELPDNARPIRFRDGQLETVQYSDGRVEEVQTWIGLRFGYQFTDDNGKNQQFVKEL